MNALEIREMIEYEQANQEVFTEQQMNEIRTFFESLTPTVEQEEVIKTVEEIEEYVLEMASVSPYFEDLFNKLRQHILQPNKAVEVIKIKIESINVLLECQIYDNKYQKSRLLLLLESYQELLKEIEGEK